MPPSAETALRRRERQGKVIGETRPGLRSGACGTGHRWKASLGLRGGPLRGRRVHFGEVGSSAGAAVHQDGFGRFGVGAARIGETNRLRFETVGLGLRPSGRTFRGSFNGPCIPGFSPSRIRGREAFVRRFFQNGSATSLPGRSLAGGRFGEGWQRGAALSNARSLAGSRRRQEYRFGGALCRCPRTRHT